MFLIIFHHVKKEKEVRSQVVVFLDEDDMSGEIFSYCETLEDPVKFPPPVMFSLTVFGLSVMTMNIRPRGVGTVSAGKPE